MKRLIVICLAIVLITGLVLSGCGEAKETEVITLKYADQNPKDGWEGKNAMQPWLKQIEDATNGRVKFEIYDAQTLCKGTDAWEALKGGVADSFTANTGINVRFDFTEDNEIKPKICINFFRKR